MSVFDGLRRLFGSFSGGSASGAEPEDMISCDEARARLFEYLDGELEQLSADEVRRHLDVCKGCYPRAQFEREFLAALSRSQENGSVAPDLKGRILEALAKEGAADE